MIKLGFLFLCADICYKGIESMTWFVNVVWISVLLSSSSRVLSIDLVDI